MKENRHGFVCAFCTEHQQLLDVLSMQDPACGACGQRFAEEMRKYPAKHTNWTGRLSEFMQKGICPRCYFDYGIDGGLQTPWTQAQLATQKVRDDEQKALLAEQIRLESEEKARAERKKHLTEVALDHKKRMLAELQAEKDKLTKEHTEGLRRQKEQHADELRQKLSVAKQALERSTQRGASIAQILIVATVFGGLLWLVVGALRTKLPFDIFQVKTILTWLGRGVLISGVLSVAWHVLKSVFVEADKQEAEDLEKQIAGLPNILTKEINQIAIQVDETKKQASRNLESAYEPILQSVSEGSLVSEDELSMQLGQVSSHLKPSVPEEAQRPTVSA